MAQTNSDRVSKGLELLNKGLEPFVQREMQAAHSSGWVEVAAAAVRDSQAAPKRTKDGLKWDTQLLLAVMVDQWASVFRKILSPSERSIIGELQGTRNRWAHQEVFSTDDAYRALDSIHRLLTAVSAPAEAAEAEKQKQELLRVRFEEQARKEHKKVATAATVGQPTSGLRPWREIITPHPDVASGRYQQAEFAADLSQVYRGEGSVEYRDPTEFFRRTFITEGLKQLLSRAILRLTGSGGDPVVELHTNFGGGKTHAMLALYHLFSKVPSGGFPGIEPVIEAANGTKPIECKRAALVGTALSIAQPKTVESGVTIHTLWGEMAYQLLGKKGYALVAASDQKGVNPGRNILESLLKQAAPCIILLDELITFIRQLPGKTDLPAGSFESNLSFIQSLTEAMNAVPKTLLVASLPSSDIEIGGETGKSSLDAVRNLVGRLESPWRPATAEEGFEIVRRRLFQPIADPQRFKERDAVIRAFMELYRGDQSKEFPDECKEADYEHRLKTAYPIHPELFERLYNDWGTLDKFQRTRGVLRLMAAVISLLWEKQDGNLMILPGMIPIEDASIQSELTRYLDDNWVPVIESDVDGPNSLPLKLDRDNANLGRYSACRRVARTIYMGSAPMLHAANLGLEDRSIKLGCVQPGESPPIFGDALRRLSDQAKHLYPEGQRYWFSTQPNITSLAQGRAAQYSKEDLDHEIIARIRKQQDQKGEFKRVHPCLSKSDEVPDDMTAGLVIAPPEFTHASKATDSPARKYVAEMLGHRGGGPRYYKNMLVFLVPDQTRLGDLHQATAQFLAWQSIENDKVKLDLTPSRSAQATSKKNDADRVVEARLLETYQWLLVPGQHEPKPDSPVEWQEFRLQEEGSLAVRASKKLLGGKLSNRYAGALLRVELDRVPLWKENHVAVNALMDLFARYLYLPRLTDTRLLLSAIEDGVRLMTWDSEGLAYADGWDETKKRYLGLKAGPGVPVKVMEQGLVVKPQAALPQLQAEGKKVYQPSEGSSVAGETRPPAYPGSTTTVDGGVLIDGKLKRFHGTIRLDATRLIRDAGKVADEVVQHLSSLMGAELEVTLEIAARVPDGVPDSVIRTVTENCRTLKFQDGSGFEAE